MLQWHEEFVVERLWRPEVAAKSFQLPLLTPADGNRMMQLFETCATTTISALRSQRPLERLLAVEILSLLNLLTRPPDNHRFLRHSSLLELCLQLLKAVASTPRLFFATDAMAPLPEASFSVAVFRGQQIMQLIAANSLQIITNLLSFLGYWGTNGVAIADKQLAAQYKNELLRGDFGGVLESGYSLGAE